MHTCLMNDTAYTVWGDVRTGTLKIYLNKWNIFSQVGSISEIPAAESIPIIPNPSNLSIQIPIKFIGETYTIFSLNGSCIVKKEVENEFIDISDLAKGSYIFRINKNKQFFNSKFIKD